MSTAASSWRRELAAPLLAAYAAIPDVAAAAVSGSTARAAADRWSDIEVMVFWLRPPDEHDRGNAAAAAGASVLRLFPFDAEEDIWCDDLSLGSDGVLAEVTHALVATAEEQLDRLLLECDPDPLLLNFAQGVVDATPAEQSPLLDCWKSRLRVYPDDLRAAAIRRNAQIDHFWRWQMFLARRNPMLSAAAFADVATRLHATMLALNRRYGPGLKSPDALSEPFEIAPPDFAARLRDSFALDAAGRAAALTRLVTETYDLIEQEVPAVDVARLREIFRHERAAAGPTD